MTIDAQNVLWGSDMPAEGNDLLCRAGEQVTVQIAPAAGYRGIHVFLSDPAISLSISEGNDAVSFLMPYAPLTLTLTADKLYTVTMDTAGGDPIRPIQYTVESEAFQLPTPVRTGYIFLGWTGEGITEPQETIEIPQGSTGDRTYTANWQVIEYTITLLDMDGAGTSEALVYTVEQPVTLPTPTREGYAFLGWTVNSDMAPQLTVVLPQGSIGNRTYTANWELTEYTITMDLNGGSGQEKVVYTITDEDFELPTPTRNGYEFVGWTGEGITMPQTSVKIPKGSTGNKAYTANWQVIKYTIITLLEGGNAGSSGAYVYTVEETFTLPTPTRTGYTFWGWTGEGITKPQPNVTIPKGSTGDKTYIENWVLKGYYITMDLNGGSGKEKVIYTITDEDFELPTPTRNGYEFVGWTGEGIIMPQLNVTIPTGSTGNKAYTANWQVIEYTITLDTNGGPNVSPIKYTVEDSFTLPYPLRPGYEFAGWTLDGSGMLPATTLIIYYGTTGDLHYKAEWRLAEYTITLDLNGGSGQEKVIYTITDEDFELPTPTRNGYEFVGWTGERITTPQTCVKIPKGSTGKKAYTANWQVIKYTIITLLEGGNAGSSGAYVYTVEETFTLPTPTRTGYTFWGWTGEGITKPQPNVTIPKGSTGDKTYIENWVETGYTITLDLNGGSGKEKVIYTMTDEDFELPTPTRNGYEFVGWTGEGITTPQTSVKIPKGSMGNKAYTANWKVIRYTITLVTNGGAVIASIRYTVEDSVTLPIPPERPGYEFAGWVLDGSGQFPSTPMIIPEGSTGDRIYEAEWRVATYTITYVSHGKAYNWVQYTIKNQVYFGAPEEDPSYYLPGYTFVGWKIDGVSGTPRSYMLPKGSYGNRTATMLWEPIP